MGLVYYHIGSEDLIMTVTIEEAQARLPELIASLAPGQDMIITQNAQPIARLSAEIKSTVLVQPRVPGSAVGQLVILGEDDEHLKDFAEYMA